MHAVQNCHWLCSEPPSASAYINLSGAGHTLKQNIDITLRLFLQLPLSLQRGGILLKLIACLSGEPNRLNARL